MLAEKILSSFEILLISDDSCILIGVKKHAESMVVPAIFQNIERNTAFSLVVWLFDILLFKEKSQIIFPHSEDALVR